MFNFLKRKKVRRFGEIAVSKGLASQKDIDEALKLQQEYKEKHQIHKEIGAILAEKGVLNPDDVTIILEDQKNQMNTMAWFSALFGLSR